MKRLSTHAHYGMNACIPLKVLCGSPNLLCDGIWRWVLPTKECPLPSGSSRIKSLATAVTDLQHILKGIQGGDRE